MKGHVRTPASVADRMVSYLFADGAPAVDARILYPGCGGDGPFITAVAEYCAECDVSMPEGVAFETHPDRFAAVRDRHADKPIEFCQEDFLQELADVGEFDYIIGNPPYVPLPDIEDQDDYRSRFETAEQRFDLYSLFFEQALTLLADDGRVVFITPEKFEYTSATSPLRRLLTARHVERIEHLPEDTFGDYATYPTITVVADAPPDETKIERRDGSQTTVDLPQDGISWAPVIREVSGETLDSGVTLGDITERISPGIATGRDKVFVRPRADVPQLVEQGWTYPTTSGKQLQLNDGPHSDDVIICPYDEDGNLISEDELGLFGQWAAEFHRDELESRSCVDTKGQAWYSWHETPPMDDIAGRPKVLFPDVTAEPQFWLDLDGEVLPRHSVYYLIPKDHVSIETLLEYLHSDQARAWLEAHCHRAANGYIRLQSRVLEDLPVPESFGKTIQAELM